MPLESPDKEFFNAAVGYAQLGMFLEANEQLENIDPFNRVAPEVLALRVDIYCGLQKWHLRPGVLHTQNQCLVPIRDGRMCT
jgi:hypothetical protein